jgi:DNA-binding CsgD family transcriptional regulator/tetratricopeptide (TPR) repeat protein
MIEGMAGRIVSPELVGREHELELIARAFRDADGGRARTVLLGGEAGIGKSRVLTAALDQARQEGAVVLLGGCIGLAEGSLPFAPIVEALRPFMRELEGIDDGAPPAPEGVPRQALSAVAAALGLLTDRPVAASAGAELRPEWARSRMYEAFLDLLRRLAVDRPVVLAIEDLHWADDSTRELLQFLVRNGQAERLLLLITFRSDELTRRHPLLFWLAEADRSAGVERVELRRLERTDVARQLNAILGHAAGPGLVASVYERSEGNPFFAEELIAAGAEGRGLPPTLREVLAARLAHVSESTMRLLGVAAVVGRKVDHDLLVQLADLSERDLYDALEEAVVAQLLVVDESTVAERYEFRHALTAEAAAETVLPSQRRRLHVIIAEALERTPRRHGAEEAGHLAEIAHHWFEGRELPRALAASVRAGEAAATSGAFVEAFRQYERALELWDVVQEPEQITGLDRVELLRRAAQAGQLSGEFMQAAGLLREGIEILEAAGDRIRAGLCYERLGRALWTSGKLNDAFGAYRTAVDLVPETPPTADRARVLAGLAQVLMLGGRYSESLPIAREANEIARATGERQLEGHSGTTLGIDLVYASPADEETGIQIIRDAMKIAEEVRDVDDIGRSYACLSSALDVVGRVEEGMQAALDGAERMRELGLSATYGAFVQMNAADGMTSLGRWDEALRLAEAAEPISRGNGRIFTNIQLARIYTLRGNAAAAQRALDHATAKLAGASEAQFSGPLSGTRMDLALWRGDIGAARTVVDEVGPIIRETDDVGAIAWFLARALRVEAEAAERGRAARDEAAVAHAVRRGDDLLAGLAGLEDASQPTGYRAMIRLATLFGHAEASRIAGQSDPAGWAEAAAAADGRPMVYEGAYARFRQGEAMLAGRGSREDASSVLAAARATAARLEAAPLVDSIDGLAARARLSLGEAATTAATAAATAARDAVPDAVAAYELTARELEVLRLVVAGKTNRQIGEELFISESTAGVHVSRILAKFGVAGRVEAATIAARLGLAD